MERPFDIRERSFLFARDALLAFPKGRLEQPGFRVWIQMISAAASGGAQLEEAEAASSRAHFVTLNRGALRELREAYFWLRLIVATKTTGYEAAARLVPEADELVAIVTTIVKRASAKLRRRSAQPGN
jgi:four helix bundle protein